MPAMSRLLLVDDDPVVARAVRRVLVRHGHEVEVCADPLTAVERVRAGQFDLVITDFRMPGLDGLKLASQIAAIAPDLPILLLTGSFDVDLARVAAVGVCEVIAKPVDTADLAEAVRKHARPSRDAPERSS
jgi:CheY-like chemotaxis protein